MVFFVLISIEMYVKHTTLIYVLEDHSCNVPDTFHSIRTFNTTVASYTTDSQAYFYIAVRDDSYRTRHLLLRTLRSVDSHYKKGYIKNLYCSSTMDGQVSRDVAIVASSGNSTRTRSYYTNSPLRVLSELLGACRDVCSHL